MGRKADSIVKTGTFGSGDEVDVRRKLLLVAGARPNYMKIAPIYWALEEGARETFDVEIVHTGQHYDPSLSDDFFRDLSLPPPSANLGVGSGTHGAQTARVLDGFEQLVSEKRPDVVVVVGDVNSTAACSLVTAKAHGTQCGDRPRPILAHVEAGLRSRDRMMPEEVNRIVTDALSDLLFTTSPDADENLRAEGHPDARIRRVGNTMIDSLLRSLPRAHEIGLPSSLAAARDSGGYALATLHRPSNVDDAERLAGILEALAHLARERPVFLPLHPRTRTRIDSFGFGRLLAPDATRATSGVVPLPPLSYLEMLLAQQSAVVVLTDSGGLQEETTALGVPCVTIRENTERPITILEGTNVLAGTTRAGILEGVEQALAKCAQTTPCPELWDGRAGERIVAELLREVGTNARTRASIPSPVRELVA